MIVDNPAARLLEILKAGKLHKNPESCRAVWYALLRVPDGDHALLAERLAKLMALPKVIAEEMQEHYPDESQMVAHWRGQVDKAFVNLNLNATWESFIPQIDHHSMMHLSTTAKLLQVVTKLKPMAQTDVESVRNQLDDLIKEVIAADLDDEIKLSIARYLRRLIDSIDEYFITGVMPILDSVNATFGNAVVDPKYRNFLTSEQLGKKVVSTVALAANLATVAAGLPLLGQVLGLLIQSAN